VIHKCSVILPENQYLLKYHQEHPHFETDKFDGTNWSSWQRLIHTAAVSKEAFGYLNGSIK